MSIKKVVKYFDSETELMLTCDPVEDSLEVRQRVDGGRVVGYLTRDEHAESPDDWKDKSIFLVNYHRDFTVKRDDIITQNEVVRWYANRQVPVAEEVPVEQEKDYHIFPLTMLSHSGVYLSLEQSFSCDHGGWDTSHVGVVLVSKKERPDEFTARHVGVALTTQWNKYLSGDVYCVVTEMYLAGKTESNSHEVVGGYYGHEYAMEELKRTMEEVCKC